MNKYSQIDFFRGFAALSVFISHFLGWVSVDQSTYIVFKRGFESAMKLFQQSGEGHPGVICFIVLSGFCIHLPYRSKKLEGIQPKKEIRKFFIRRFMRIFPLFLLASLLGIALIILTDGSPVQTLTEQFSGSTRADITWQNILLKLSTLAEFRVSGYPQTYLGNAPLASVVTEIWLYICYPFFFYVLRKKGWGNLLLLTLLLYSIFPLIYLYLGREPGYSWWLFSIFNYYILWTWGAYLCEVTFDVIKIDRKKIYSIWWISILGYFLCLVLLYAFHWHLIKYVRMLLLAGAFGSMLSILIHPAYRPDFLKLPTIVRPVYRAICYLGDFSYSLYAIHAPLIFLALWSVANYGLNNKILMVFPLLVLSLSLLTYRLIEMPTHKLAKQLTK